MYRYIYLEFSSIIIIHPVEMKPTHYCDSVRYMKINNVFMERFKLFCLPQ